MWLQDLVAKFGPVTERADNTTVLDFERPLAELDSRIREVRFCVFFSCVEMSG
jgi:acetyl-CoA carboxylase carboxyl transferase subunit alpha